MLISTTKKQGIYLYQHTHTWYASPTTEGPSRIYLPIFHTHRERERILIWKQAMHCPVCNACVSPKRCVMTGTIPCQIWTSPWPPALGYRFLRWVPRIQPKSRGRTVFFKSILKHNKGVSSAERGGARVRVKGKREREKETIGTIPYWEPCLLSTRYVLFLRAKQKGISFYQLSTDTSTSSCDDNHYFSSDFSFVTKLHVYKPGTISAELKMPSFSSPSLPPYTTVMCS
jgi:hypothetical protein